MNASNDLITALPPRTDAETYDDYHEHEQILSLPSSSEYVPSVLTEKSYLMSQEKLNDLVRELNLTQRGAEILG